MKTSELLRKAADEIRRRGWHQGDYGSSIDNLNGCAVCSLGAISAAATFGRNPWPAGGGWGAGEQGAAEFLARVTTDDSYPSGVIDWNDTAGRTVEEVLEAFERAAVAAEREEQAA